MSELLKEMGQRILERRKQLNMTQETLANLTHLTSQTISYAEMGQKAMRPETMLKICEALGISADYLLRGKILEADTSLLQQKISTLTPSQYRHLDRLSITLLLPYRKRKRYESRHSFAPIPLF